MPRRASVRPRVLAALAGLKKPVSARVIQQHLPDVDIKNLRNMLHHLGKTNAVLVKRGPGRNVTFVISKSGRNAAAKQPQEPQPPMDMESPEAMALMAQQFVDVLLKQSRELAKIKKRLAELSR
jgi:hypothetical protein